LGKEITVASANIILLAADWLPVILNPVLLLSGIFLILLVLIQRGKGGGLAGAFGGVGGSSPFGSRAGDTFTRITLYMAAVWVLVIMIHVKVAQHDGASARSRPAITTSTP
jgi:preprotein translocase subunit SecG